MALLFFRHLESKDSKFKQWYIGQYVALLDQLYHARIPCAGYISLPKSKELVNLIRVELCSFVWDGCTKHTAVDHVTDTTIARFFLTQGTRTTVFKSNASIGSWYPEHLAPHFFYADMGSEIVRIEIPAWIAQEKELLAWMCAVIADQARKGQGYPIALAEAHEQAVVKGPDREFFYQLINKMSIEQQHRLLMSQKNSKKRCPGI